MKFLYLFLVLLIGSTAQAGPGCEKLGEFSGRYQQVTSCSPAVEFSFGAYKHLEITQLAPVKQNKKYSQLWIKFSTQDWGRTTSFGPTNQENDIYQCQKTGDSLNFFDALTKTEIIFSDDEIYVVRNNCLTSYKEVKN